MKHFFPLFALCMPGITALLVFSCTKDSPAPKGVTTLIEEFDNVSILQQKGWIMTDNATGSGGTAPWGQGINGPDKAGIWHGFTAFSYNSLQDEFIYSYIAGDSSSSMSSWLITPVLSASNGDKISFYTRGDTTGIYTDRMQVLLNHSASPFVGTTMDSNGDFTTTLFDINSAQRESGYPTNWTKYDYTFTDLTEKTNVRIAFRHYTDHPTNARGVGLDLFKFDSH